MTGSTWSSQQSTTFKENIINLISFCQAQVQFFSRYILGPFQFFGASRLRHTTSNLTFFLFKPRASMSGLRRQYPCNTFTIIWLHLDRKIGWFSFVKREHLVIIGEHSGGSQNRILLFRAVMEQQLTPHCVWRSLCSSLSLHHQRTLGLCLFLLLTSLCLWPA